MKFWNIVFKRRTGRVPKALGGVHKGTLPVARHNAGPKDKNELSYRLAGKILRVHEGLATFLNTKTKGISKLRMKLFFTCFLLLSGAYCLYLILSAVLNFLQ
ncbi:hypothetical protein D3C87_607500 [compost metagenome]